MGDNVEITVPAEHVRFEREGRTRWAVVLVPRDLVVLVADEVVAVRSESESLLT